MTYLYVIKSKVKYIVGQYRQRTVNEPAGILISLTRSCSTPSLEREQFVTGSQVVRAYKEAEARSSVIEKQRLASPA